MAWELYRLFIAGLALWYHMTIEGLKAFGLREMDEGQIRDFLANQGMGVLGLPVDGVPYLLPMSFGYDGESRLYFSFFLGEESRKRELSDRAEHASFLVYSADSPFFWESVALEGTIDEVAGDAWDDHAAAMDNAWHLQLFERAETPGRVELYEFTITDQRGLAYTGLPPGLREDGPADDAE